jgi:hypothetical protein
MRPHVTDESVPDLAEGALNAGDQAHVAQCAACATRVAEARLALEMARGADVPEPSPLYWEALRHNVSQRIAEEKRAPSRLWLLLPAALAAGLVAALLMRPAPPSPLPEPRLAAWSALPPAEDDQGLAVLEGLAVAQGELPAWDEERGLGAFLAGLSEEESRTLAEGLRRAGKGGES